MEQVLLVFLAAGANFLNMIKENAPEIYKNTAVLPQLTGNTGMYDFSLMSLSVPAGARNKETALKFAFFLTNADNQLSFSKLVPILPVNKKALENDFFLKADENDLEAQARIISAQQLRHIQPPMKNITRKNELNALSSRAVQEILINNKDIQETLDRFKSDWQQLQEQ